MKKFCTAIALLVSSTAAFANGVYVGGTVGYARADLDCAGTDSCDNNTAAVKGFVGYQFNDTFAVEGSFFDLGKPEASFSGMKLGLKSTGFGVRGLASIPLGTQASGFFALGVNQVKSKATVTATGFSGSQSNTSTTPSVALGVDYSLTAALKLRAELESFRVEALNDGDSDTDYTVRNFSVGVKYSF